MATSKEMVESLKEAWAQAVENKDIEALMGLYLPSALLQPTLSAYMRTNAEEIRDYFVGSDRFNDPGFLNNEITKVKFEKGHTVFEDGFGVDMGRYVFVKSDGSEVVADYTFVLVRRGDQAKILAHHSSLV